MTGALRVAVCGGLLLLACSQQDRPASRNRSSTPPSATGNGASDGSGGAASGRGAGTGASSTGPEVPCTPSLSPGDEFYVPCPDAGADMQVPPRVPGPDSGATPAPDDAGGPLDPSPDAATPPPADSDEGTCARRSDDCTFGHVETSFGSATCSIFGDFLSVEHEVCEVCGQDTSIIGFSVAVMDCGGCTQVYRESTAVFGMALSANSCTTHEQSATLTLTLADPLCLDVYAQVSSGVESTTGQLAQSGDQVRVCRCNRATNTCTSCDGGVCDPPP